MTLISALMIHLIALFGIGFNTTHTKQVQQSLEITLSQYQSEQAPKAADFLAQTNQIGSGDLEEKALLSTTQHSDFSDNVVREVYHTAQPITQAAEYSARSIITTTAITTEKQTSKEGDQKDSPTKIAHDQQIIEQYSLEIASLEAQLRDKKQAHAKRPRKRQLTAVSTKAARDAAYLDAWRSKIEQVGNINYPTLKIDNLYGHLRLMVAVKQDGTVDKIRILKSSGYKRLDDAAIKVVRMSVPFAPFPPEVRQDTDILEIIRTWHFEKSDLRSNFNFSVQ